MSLDLKITGGMIYDGNGNDGVTADIGICDGHIVEIGATVPLPRHEHL